jgi:hypothetical protein
MSKLLTCLLVSIMFAGCATQFQIGKNEAPISQSHTGLARTVSDRQGLEQETHEEITPSQNADQETPIQGSSYSSNPELQAWWVR